MPHRSGVASIAASALTSIITSQDVFLYGFLASARREGSLQQVSKSNPAGDYISRGFGIVLRPEKLEQYRIA